MVAEPTATPDPSREKLVQLAFERFGAPAVFLAKAAVLTAFANGRATGLVVDVGGQSTTVSAVHDGYVLRRSLARSPLGGDALTEAMLRAVEAKAGTGPSGGLVRPRYSFTRREVRPGEFAVADLSFPATTESYLRFKRLEVAADMKESACRAYDDAYTAAGDTLAVPTVSYELPDGSTIEVGPDRFLVPELLFNPELLATLAPGFSPWDGSGMAATAAAAAAAPAQGQAQAQAQGQGQGPLKGLPRLVRDCLERCDPDVQRDLYGNLLLTGGGSLFAGLPQRLEKEVAALSSSAVRVRVSVPATAAERRFGVWIGGSILASLGSFQQMWMSKQEYEEHGAGLILKKAP